MRFNFNQSQLFIASLTSKLVELDFRFVFGWQLLRVNKKNGESETDGSRSDPDRRTSDWTATARTDTNGRRLSALLLEMIKPERKGTEQKGKGKETQSTNAKRIVSTIDSFSFFFVPLSHLFWNSQIVLKYIIYRFTWRVKTVSKEKRLLNIRKIAFCSIRFRSRWRFRRTESN